MPELTFRITSVTEKTRGSTEKGDWILYGVAALSETGKAWNFVTFDGEWENHAGETVTADYQYDAKRKSSLLGKFPTRVPAAVVAGSGGVGAPAPTSASRSPQAEPLDKFGMVIARLDEALILLRDLKKHFAD